MALSSGLSSVSLGSSLGFPGLGVHAPLFLLFRNALLFEEKSARRKRKHLLTFVLRVVFTRPRHARYRLGVGNSTLARVSRVPSLALLRCVVCWRPGVARAWPLRVRALASRPSSVLRCQLVGAPRAPAPRRALRTASYTVRPAPWLKGALPQGCRTSGGRPAGLAA